MIFIQDKSLKHFLDDVHVGHAVWETDKIFEHRQNMTVLYDRLMVFAETVNYWKSALKVI